MADPNNPNGPRGIYVLPEADISHIKRHHSNLRYGNESPFQALDLFLPETEASVEGYPLVVFVHGGAWMMCDKRDIQLTAPLQLLQHGFAVASINYRLSSEAHFPAQIYDVKAALYWLQERAANYELNAHCVALWGASAGAHLANLTATSAGAKALEPPNSHKDKVYPPLRAVVSWFGPTDFLWMDNYFHQTQAGLADHSSINSPESKLLGGCIQELSDLVRQANPETWLTPECPPFLIQHGLPDPIVPFQHSVVFAHKITAVARQRRVYLDIFPNAGHGGEDFSNPKNILRIKKFLDENLVHPRSETDKNI
ncbi:alpha/beta hydrolase [Rhodoferax mekongensis]|uniref:alpha/beta hydrolase n=1 Tax=Rhodoferax mekongensis TaxID=3068341 RepID=UPI0028BE397D|nr:alpha/beta hydrolase [Rhodoferax sp. TBRC 17199]MDT7517088.1 alpha/beta hydrolase [Rhodoferax sp. TBRC 17199]